MSHLNLTLMLASLGEWSNHSPAIVRSDHRPVHTRLVEMLKRLNESQMSTLNRSDLLSELLNASEQAYFGFQSYPAAETQPDFDSEPNTKSVGLWLQIVLYALYGTILIIGSIGNALVCYAVARNPTMHTVTNVFIFNLGCKLCMRQYILRTPIM